MINCIWSGQQTLKWGKKTLKYQGKAFKVNPNSYWNVEKERGWGDNSLSPGNIGMKKKEAEFNMENAHFLQ